MEYKPKPINTSVVKLSKEILELTETLAKNAHDIWAQNRIAEGWIYGPRRDDALKQHPCLVPYEKLPDSEKEYDRSAAMKTLKAIVALGYRIDSPSGHHIPKPIVHLEEVEGLIKQLKDPSSLSLSQLLRLWDARSDKRHSNKPEYYQRLGERILKVGEPLLAYDVLNEGWQTWPNDVRIQQLLGLALARSGATHRANAILNRLREAGFSDGETLGILARTHKDLSKMAIDPAEKKEQLELAHNIYNEALDLALKGKNLDDAIYNGINAASTALLLDQKDNAKALASKVQDICMAKLKIENDYWALASLGEAAIILGEIAEAEERYTKAAEVGHGNVADLSTIRKQARILLEYKGLDKNRLDHCFHIPKIVVFAGHMIDQPGRPKPRFPYYLEKKIYREIVNKLKEFNAGVAYSSAACGSDILFLEAMLERKGEINVILPFVKEEFKKASVDIIPDSDWSNRFDTVIEQAAQIITTSEHRTTGNLIAYEYANQLQDGLAILRAKMLDEELISLVVWNGQPGDGEKGTFSQVEHWRSCDRKPELIDIARLLNKERVVSTDSASHKPMPSTGGFWTENFPEFTQEIRAMLFSDVVRYSKLQDEQIPSFIEHFMGAVDKIMAEFEIEPLTKNTWGDALYCVFDSVNDAGNFALKLRDHICSIDWEQKGLPKDLNLRISLHAGPVYSFIDPVLKTQNYSGAHVSRGARIEPITPPGEVYASQEFAALVSSQGVKDFICEYVGKIPLPKKSGIIPLYLVRRKNI